MAIIFENIELTVESLNFSLVSTFLAIAETGQLNRAAEQLHVTQSTVTARLNNLESELGQRLFHRRKSGAELTSAGFRFQRYAQLMVDAWRQARQETALPASIESTFNLGCQADLWPRLGERLFEYLHEHHPEVAISAWSGEQPELDRWLGSGLVDAALGYAPSHREGFSDFPLPPERLVLVATQPRSRVRQDPGYIYIDGGEAFRKQHAAEYPDGDTPTVVLSSARWGLDYLLDRGGSGYLPWRLAADAVKRGHLHPVEGAAEFSRAVYFIVDTQAIDRWPWFDDLLRLLQSD